MQTISSRDGTEIGFQRSGAGPLLLFVHGTTADHRSWAKLSSILEEDFTVLVMDRRGRGESTDSPNYDLIREGEDVASVVDACDAPVHLFGHSYGGLCGLQAALLTDNIRRLILYDPVLPLAIPVAPAGIIDRIEAFVEENEHEAAMELFLREVAGMPEDDLQAYRQTSLWEQRLPVIRTVPREVRVVEQYEFDFSSLEGMDLAALLITSEDSPSIYARGVDLLHNTLPDSKVVVLDGEQHIAHHTNPNLLASLLREHLLHSPKT